MASGTGARWYRGWIGTGGECHVLVSTGTMPQPLQADATEFPDRVTQLESFDWGRPSRGAVVLARTLLVDALGPERAGSFDPAEFMFEVLLRFPKGPDWQLTDGDIERWAAAARSHQYGGAA
jgi:hypothetical protein